MCLFEALLPVTLTSNKDGDTVDEPYAGSKNLLDVPLGSSFGSNRKIVHNDIGSRILENSHDIVGLSRHFVLINVKGGSELDIVYVIASKVDMHQARNESIWLCLTIVMDALH